MHDSLRERLAADEHDRWSRWQRHLHAACLPSQNGPVVNLVIPGPLADRWGRQIATAYKDLSEAEKDSDRAEADKTLATVRDWLRTDEAVKRKVAGALHSAMCGWNCPGHGIMEPTQDRLYAVTAAAVLAYIANIMEADRG